MTLFRPNRSSCNLPAEAYQRLQAEASLPNNCGHDAIELATEFLSGIAMAADLHFVRVTTFILHLDLEITDRDGTFYVLTVMPNGINV